MKLHEKMISRTETEVSKSYHQSQTNKFFVGLLGITHKIEWASKSKYSVGRSIIDAEKFSARIAVDLKNCI